MIATVACTLALADNLAVGQKWHYVQTWHFVGQGIDMTDEENFDVEVSKVLTGSVTLKVTQRLTATILDGQRIPTDSKAVPAVHQWALSPTGSIAFMPDGRYGLESRVYRVLKGILPEPKGDPSRATNWSLMFPDDGLGMPLAKLEGALLKPTKEGSQFTLSYREKIGTNGVGTFERTEKSPFPTHIDIHFTNTKMSGGTDIVNCDFAMNLK